MAFDDEESFSTYTGANEVWGEDEDDALILDEEDDDELLDEEDEDDLDDEDVPVPAEVMIIPGNGVPLHSIVKRRRRPIIMQFLLVAVIFSLVLSALFSIAPLRDPALASGSGQNPFSALAQAIAGNASQDPFHLYRARSGDTFESIAQDQGATIGGIYKLNALYATDEVELGKIYKIPNDPTFGLTFVAPLPPGANIAGNLYPAQNYNPVGNICNFCAVAGVDNGPGGNCAPNWQSLTGGDVVGYNLIDPDQPQSGTPASHWVRGFTGYGSLEPHSGADVSTGQFGTPLYAAQDGQVIFAPRIWESGSGGLTVKINHCGGLATSYSHMQEILVNQGDNVKQGQLIGYQGSTGNSTGPHLHYMTWWHNIPFDPLCAYPNGLSGYSSNNHYGGCPPDLIKGSYWNR